jgi:hypothetical protein
LGGESGVVGDSPLAVGDSPLSLGRLAAVTLPAVALPAVTFASGALVAIVLVATALVARLGSGSSRLRMLATASAGAGLPSKAP